MSCDPIVFVDLEDTVINEWFPIHGEMVFLPEKVRKLKKFLEINKVSGITIFSFACYSLDEVPAFDSHLRAGLSAGLGIRPDAIDIANCKKLTTEMLDRYAMDFFEVCMYFTKFRTFVEYAAHTFRDRAVVLIDDDVPNTEQNYKDQLLRIVTLNVDTPNWEETKLKS
jgi:hypothetical protein